MAKKTKQQSRKSQKKTWLKEIEAKLAESLKDYDKKGSERKFKKNLRKAGKLLSRSLSRQSIMPAPKKAVRLKKATAAPEVLPDNQVPDMAPEVKSISQ